MIIILYYVYFIIFFKIIKKHDSHHPFDLQWGEGQLEKEKTTSDVGTKKYFYICFVNILKF